MGAGNVKASARVHPPPLKLPTDAWAQTTAPRAGQQEATHHIGVHIGNGGGEAQQNGKKWSVTCSIHRSLICRFCGGRSCKHEDYRRQKDTPAITGLHSTWISANVLAMQRPSSRIIKEHRIVEQFKKAGIGAVLNLQLAGEHPHCGDGIGPHGFSYRPEELTDAGIYYYNPGWVDMDTPTLEKMVEIAQIMEYHTLRSEKVAVHCHAGLGRTGIVIACFFVFAHNLAPEVAIKSVRDRRRGTVQTRKQQTFVARFAEYVAFLRTVFYDPRVTSFALKHARSPRAGSQALQAINHAALASESSDENQSDSEFGVESRAHGQAAHTVTSAGFPGLLFSRRNAALLTLVHAERDAFDADRYTLHEALSRQRAALHGDERSSLKLVPKLVHVLCERLRDLAQHNPRLAARAFMDGFRRAGPVSASSAGGGSRNNSTRAFEAERERERERRKAKERARRDREREAAGGAVSGIYSVRRSSLGGGSLARASPSPSPPDAPAAPAGDGSLASLAAHGALAAHFPSWDLASFSASSMTRATAQQHLANPAAAAAAASAQADKEDGPKWTPIQDDTLADLKRRVNAGDWTPLETCDVRYCAQLLFEWLDALKSPLLPLFDRKDAPLAVGASVAPYALNPHQINATPSTVFASLPRWTLATLDPILRLLYDLRGLDVPTLAKIYARFAFALTHPRAALPEHLAVHRTHYQRTQGALSARIAQAGLTVQTLVHAAQAQLVQAQQTLQAPGVTVAAKSAALALLKSPPHSFDALHVMLPPPRALLEGLVEFLAGFTRGWAGAYAKILAAEERLAAGTRVGVRKSETIEMSHAQLADVGAGANTQLRPYAEATKLGVGTQLGLEVTRAGRHPLAAPEQTQEHSALQSRAEVSTTAYLHSRIHHAQPRDGSLGLGLGEQDRRKLESQLLVETLTPIAANRNMIPTTDSGAASPVGADGIDRDDTKAIGGGMASRLGGVVSGALVGRFDAEASDLPSAREKEEEGAERLNGFLSHRRMGADPKDGDADAEADADELGEADAEDDDAVDDELDQYDEARVGGGGPTRARPSSRHAHHSSNSASSSFYLSPSASPTDQNPTTGLNVPFIPLPGSAIDADESSPKPMRVLSRVPEPDAEPATLSPGPMRPRVILTRNPAAQVDKPIAITPPTVSPRPAVVLVQ